MVDISSTKPPQQTSTFSLAAIAPQTRLFLRYETMPLAVYRELQSHLRQVMSIEVELVTAGAIPFDYAASQIAGLWLEFNENVTAADRDRVRSILDYYSLRFGAWSAIDE